MTTIGPSQNFVELIKNSKAAQGNEKANIINQQEADSIKNQFLKETQGLNEQQTKEYIQAAETLLKSEFSSTNVSAEFKLTDGSKEVTKPTLFSFNIKGKVETQKEVPPPPSKLVADGKDFNKVERQSLKDNPDGQNIIKRYDALASNPLNSLTGKPNLNSASKEDLKGLKDTFGDDANKFLDALHNNPSFSTATIKDAQTILKFAKDGCKNESDVKDLQNALKNVGPDLKARFEKNGANEGQGKGIDGEYGFATMEGVRYLSSVIQSQQPTMITETQNVEASGDGQALDSFTNLIPEDSQVMVAIDTSGSMSGNDRSTLNKYDQVINNNPTSDVGFMTFNSNSEGNGGEVMFKPGQSTTLNKSENKNLDKAKTKFNEAEKSFNTIQTKYNDLNQQYKTAIAERPRDTNKINTIVENRKNVSEDLSKAREKFLDAKSDLNSARSDLNAVQRNVVNNSVDKSNGTHKESGSNAALKAMDQIDPKGKKPYVLVQTDEPDHNPETMKNLIMKGMSNNSAVPNKSVVFYNPDSRETINLEDIIKKVSTNGKFDESKFNALVGKHEGVKSFAIFNSQNITNGIIK